MIRRYDHPDVHLAIDGKHKTMERGWVVVSVAPLTKDCVRNTALVNHTTGASRTVQGPAMTTRARTVLQAVVENDHLGHHAVALLQALCDRWFQLRGESLAPKVKQLHKDFADGFEHARKQLFPQSRAVDCSFHFLEKSKTVAAKCRQLAHVRGTYVKQHYDFVMNTCHTLREAPTGALFSVLWQSFLARLSFLGEDTAAQYLRMSIRRC